MHKGSCNSFPLSLWTRLWAVSVFKRSKSLPSSFRTLLHSVHRSALTDAALLDHTELADAQDGYLETSSGSLWAMYFQ